MLFVEIYVNNNSFMIIYSLEFFKSVLADGLSLELGWQRVSRTLLSILTVLNNAVVWMVSTHPPSSKSSNPWHNPLVTIPKAPITIGIIVTFMFHSLFNSLTRSKYLSYFSHFFRFIVLSAGTAKSTVLQILFFFFLVIIIRFGLLAEIRWSVCMSKSHRSLRGSLNKFPEFLVWALLLIVHTWNSSLLRSNILRLQCTCCTVPITSASLEVLLCQRVNDLRHSLFRLLNCLITTASEVRE